MQIFNMQIDYLNVIAIVVILIAVFREMHGRSAYNFTLLTIISASAAVHAANSGISGIVFVAAGMAVAAICNYSGLRYSATNRRRFLISVMIGAVVGPAGAFFIFMIVLIMNLLQGFLRASTTSVRDRYATCLADGSMVPGWEEARSPVARIEAKRFGSEEIDKPGRCGSTPGSESGSLCTYHAFPWSAKIAIATLTVLLSGVFV